MLPAVPFPIVFSQTTRFEVVQRDAMVDRAAGAGATATAATRRAQTAALLSNGISFLAEFPRMPSD